jgi:hypothetical protein
MKTVRFYEIVGPEHQRLDDMEWPGMLSDLAQTEFVRRAIEVRGDELLGTTYTASEETEILLLSRGRDSDDLPDLLNRENGDLAQLEVAENQGLVETSHIGFFNPGNIVGVMRTTASPSSNALEDWLNGMGYFETKVRAAPLSRVNVNMKLRDVEQARSIRVRMNTSAAGAISNVAPRLSSTVARLNEEFGSVMVEMRIYIPQDQGFEEESAAILEEAQGLATVPASDVSVVEMAYRSIEKQRKDAVDFVKDELAEQVLVQLRDVDGEPVKNRSAADAIVRAYEHLRLELVAAVERDRG